MCLQQTSETKFKLIFLLDHIVLHLLAFFWSCALLTISLFPFFLVPSSIAFLPSYQYLHIPLLLSSFHLLLLFHKDAAIHFLLSDTRSGSQSRMRWKCRPVSPSVNMSAAFDAPNTPKGTFRGHCCTLSRLCYWSCLMVCILWAEEMDFLLFTAYFSPFFYPFSLSERDEWGWV